MVSRQLLQSQILQQIGQLHFKTPRGTVAYLSDITGGGASEFSTVAVNTSVIFEGTTADAK